MSEVILTERALYYMQFGLLFSGWFLDLLVLLVSQWKDNREEILERYLDPAFEDNAEQAYEVFLEVFQGLAG